MAEITVNKDNFESIIKGGKPVLFDFWATWCGPCRMLSPVIAEIAAENTDITVGKVNVDEEPELANAFRIDAIPTLIVFKDGKAAGSLVGFADKARILELIK